MQRPSISHSYGVVGKSCASNSRRGHPRPSRYRTRSKSGTFPSRSRSDILSNRSTSAAAQASTTPGTPIASACDRAAIRRPRHATAKARRPTNPRSVEPPSRSHHAISAARSRHHQRSDPGIFHRPQQGRVLGCPRRQGQIGGIFLLENSALAFARKNSRPSGCATISIRPRDSNSTSKTTAIRWSNTLAG